MRDGETSAEPLPSPAVPPASRLGTILGWGLLALGVALLAACLLAAISADSAKHAWDAALDRSFYSKTGYDAVVAAEAAYRGATVHAYLLFGAAFLSLCTVPGLVYAFRPQLLGGPLGRLLRMASANVARYRGVQQPLTLYQGLGVAVQGAGSTIFALVSATMTLVPSAFWLIFPALLLWPAANVWSIALLGGSWWFTGGRRQPTAGNSGHEAAWGHE